MLNYTASNFEGVCTIEESFKPYLDCMNEISAKYGITVVVIDSLRKPVDHLPGEIVPPAKMSNHIVGHAVDADLKYKQAYMTGRVLQTMYSTNTDIQNFIHDLITAGLRWGGLFSTPDPVHFDDGLNIHNPALYNQLLANL